MRLPAEAVQGGSGVRAQQDIANERQKVLARVWGPQRAHARRGAPAERTGPVQVERL